MQIDRLFKITYFLLNNKKTTAKDLAETFEVAVRTILRDIDILSYGGASSNNFLMDFQANISNCPVLRPRILETTALGAAYLAGLGIGFWDSMDSLRKIETVEKTFSPSMAIKKSELRNWKKAIAHSEGWLNEVEE